MSETAVVIDACSSLNLFASGRPIDIVKAAKLHLLVLPEVEAEAQHLLGEPDDEGLRPQEPIDWTELYSSGAATSHPFPADAFPALIELAAQLTDIDARCLALVNHLGVGLLSDDGKVRRVLSATGKGRIHSTVSLIREAAAALALRKGAVRMIFGRIQERARFEPPRRDPDYDWYVSQVAP